MIEQMTSPVIGSPEFPGRMSSDEPHPLPYSAYARARDVSQHGVQPLPESLPVLKVTHHGSNTSSTPLFLSRFRPKIAVIQCGADNPYGHPTPETLERLQKTGAKIFRNDEDGDVIVTIKDKQVDVAVTKP
jgi:beta-lactamase superfamily II metal-dependent hydrolase